jgi:2-oxo-4-hydroxy-4-carboxy-5-ureidoimidazoline decarboxylase
MTIAELNALDCAAFVDAVGWVFEHSPWVAERAWLRKPFATAGELHSAMVVEVETGTPEEQLALLRAHPDLGARAKMTDASTSEQAGAGLDNLRPSEFARLQRLNTQYRDKFGFPFLYAVKGSTKHDILEALEARVAAGHDAELHEALRQVSRIARFRLEGIVSTQAGPLGPGEEIS